jgi:hypothetical protein
VVSYDQEQVHGSAECSILSPTRLLVLCSNLIRRTTNSDHSSLLKTSFYVQFSARRLQRDAKSRCFQFRPHLGDVFHGGFLLGLNAEVFTDEQDEIWDAELDATPCPEALY